MKKNLYALLAMVAMICLTASMSFGAVSVWKTANQVTISWPPVTTLVDGTPLPAGYSIIYKIYVKPEGSTSPPTEVGTETVPQATITFSSEGRYVIGVKTVRLDSGGNAVSEGSIAWSDDPAAAKNGVTFGAMYFIAPAPVTGMEPR